VSPKTDPFAILPDMTAAEICATVLDREAHAFAAGLAATMLTGDPEGPHRARVALRRLRSAVWAFRPILRPKVADKLNDRARALFLMLGEIRDADVLLDAHVGPRLERVQLAEAAAEVRARIRRDLRDARALHFAARIEKLVATGKWRGRGSPARKLAEKPATTLARNALDRSWTACAADGPDILTMPDEVLHDLRKRIKRLRYLVEYFGPLWPGLAEAAWADDLRAMQDALGRYCDLKLAAERGVATGDPEEAAEATEAAAAIWAGFRLRQPFWRADSAEQASGPPLVQGQ